MYSSAQVASLSLFLPPTVHVSLLISPCAMHIYTYMYIDTCKHICWPLPSNQSFYRQVAGYWKGVGDHRVG